MTDQSKRYGTIKKSTYVSAVCNIILSILKIFIGWIGNSQALIADGIHSFSDLLTDVFVLVAAKAGKQSADASHPYGHGRIETAATIIIGIFLGIIGFTLGLEAAKNLLHHNQHLVPGTLVIVTALFAIIVNYVIYIYLLRLSKQIHSPLLLGNANHHKTDIYVSVAVLVSVCASRIGLPILDHVITIIIALMIIKMGIMMIYDCFRELVDTAVDAATLQEIHDCITKTEGVKSLHQCRTRTITGKILLDVHVIVDDNLSVSEGHYIGDKVIYIIKSKIPNVMDVIVHIDTEDDEHHETANMPTRSEIMPQIESKINNEELWQQLQEVKLHYIQKKIQIELYFPLSVLKNITSDQMKNDIENKLKDIYYIKKINIFYN
jgi:cation diffusion facilitator family transporter